MNEKIARINSGEIRGRIRTYSSRPVGDIRPYNRQIARPISDFKVVHKPTINSRNTTKIYNNVAKKPEQVIKTNVEEKTVHDVKKEIIEPNKETSKSLIKKNKLINNLLLAMAVFVFLIGAFASLYSLKVDKQITETVSAQSANPDIDVSEDKPTEEDIKYYSVAPEMPKLIYVPKLDIKSRVKQIGLNSKGQLDVPGNIHDAAWYKESALPGSAGGASIIDGHVSGPTQKGVFYNLNKLSEGDKISIEKGNGEIINYTVKKIEVQNTSDVDMANMLVPITPGTHGLNLISCTGKYDSESKDFEQRVLVFAERI